MTGRWDTSYHAPVMVEEVLKLLGGSKEVLDCTLGGGGHSEALLAAGASVTALDQDEAALNQARKRLAAHEAAAASAHSGAISATSTRYPKCVAATSTAFSLTLVSRRTRLMPTSVVFHFALARYST